MNSNDLDELELRLLTQLWSMEEGFHRMFRQLDRIEKFLAGEKPNNPPMSVPSFPRPQKAEIESLAKRQNENSEKS